MSGINVGAASLNLIPLDWKNNERVMKMAIHKAREENVNLLCLPELCITGYGCQDMFFSPWVSEKSINILFSLIDQTDNIYVTFGFPLWWNNKLYNASALAGNGALLGISLKQNLPDDGIYYEPRWFTPWPKGKTDQIVLNGNSYDIGEVIYEIHGIKVAFEICEDAWRENRPADLLCPKGAQIILNPSASHFEFNKGLVREDLMRRSSKKFNCVFVHANMLGNESGRIIFDGDAIIAQNGSILKSGERLSMGHFSLTSTHVVIGEVPSETPTAQLLSKYWQFHKSATLALHDYLRKSSSKCFIISLSGGADSACCAVLVAEMINRSLKELGKVEFANRINRPELLDIPEEKWVSSLLYCVYQSTKNSSDVTFNAAKTLAEELGATFYSWSVEEEVSGSIKKIENAIDRKLDWSTDDITLQNVQARMRSPFVWVLANLYNGLLITTSNRSEGDVGYATMDGDTSGSLAPIAGVDKVFVLEWLNWAEKELNIKSLKLVNEQSPTAELRPAEMDQSDEADLMPYTVLLFIERKFLKDKLSPSEIKEKLRNEKNLEETVAVQYIEKFFKLWGRNQWKRERLAPSFHFDDFNIDPKSWMRFPILNSGFKDDLGPN
ncbi:MAG: NAD(+) synthase [Cyclobacteriaceae bacterium]|nr:NAD(+) synthase [Cyclobacteriaceae bacterium]